MKDLVIAIIMAFAILAIGYIAGWRDHERMVIEQAK